MKGKRAKISFFLILSMSGFYGCHLVKKPIVPVKTTEHVIKQDSLEVHSLEIFEIPTKKMNEEIKELLSAETESYYKLTGDQSQIKTCMFVLTCDTFNGRILDVVLHHSDADFQPYVKRLIDYFKSFSSIKPATYAKSGKVNTYWILISVEGGLTSLEVDYGYEDF